jgi:bifunctional non-homologous end joining protein LigD
LGVPARDILQPMLASLADAPLDDPELVYEPKYDGIRAIAEVSAESVRLWSRLGNEKTRQFPEITAALQQWARKLKEPIVLDGEIVALDGKGEPAGFQQLQGRIHLHEAPALSEHAVFQARVEGPEAAASRSRTSARPAGPTRPTSPKVAFIAFDLLRNGRADLRDRPLLERRAALERVFGKTESPLLRISAISRGNGRALHKAALERGWEGLIAKHAASLYKSGKRTPDWRKLKIVHEQEFVIGGWTEPRQTRSYFGALLLGVYGESRIPPGQSRIPPGQSRIPPGQSRIPPGQSRIPNPESLIYVGHTGTGFNERELARLMKLLKPLETSECPFASRPKTNERPHWVRPELVAQVRFTEWTADAKLRHPVYLGLRDDKKPTDVTREQEPKRRSGGGVGQVGQVGRVGQVGQVGRAGPVGRVGQVGRPSDLIQQLDDLQKSRRDGVLALPDGGRLNVTNLHKVFWPKLKLTKGDLFRYYARMARFILPAVADRPLVMKRFPNGVAGPPFYQHRAPEVPEGVRSEVVSVAEARPQIIGGDLETLLYTTQLAAISQDPWFSRVAHPQFADYAAFDLDPSEGVPYARVLDVARWIRDELDALKAFGVPKTSGSEGLHIYIPLPAGTPYDAGLLFCQIVATVVVQKHPTIATIERSVKARGKRVYIDCLQNILGKTLATAYSARASDWAGVSTPLTWAEVDAGVDPRGFTIETVPARLERVGDLWAALRKSRGVNLESVTRYTARIARTK